MDNKAFSLIELVIVISILGILATISIPNFLNAQIRAKLVKALTNMKTIEYTLEAYYLDKDTFPRRGGHEGGGLLDLTTPVPYLSNVITLIDPFDYSTEVINDLSQDIDVDEKLNISGFFIFYTIDLEPPDMCGYGFPRTTWLLSSKGPDGDFCWGCVGLMNSHAPKLHGYYQASNGLISLGDIYRTGGTIQFKAWRFQNIDYLVMN